MEQKGVPYPKEDIAASFTKVVTDSVIKKLKAAFERYEYKTLVLAGGVSANSHLREALSDFATKNGLSFYVPDISLCGDNAAMIGAQAYYEYLENNLADTSLNAYAVSEL